MAIAIWKPVAAGAISLCCISMVYADTERSGFYTILGPDGQMIVIDRNASRKDENPAGSKAQAEPRLKWSLFGNNKKGKAVQQPESSVPAVTPAQPASASTPQSIQPVVISQPSVSAPKQPEQQLKPAQATSALSASESQQKAVDASREQAPVKAEAAVSIPPVTQEQASRTPVTVIDGEQYIDSEYLEQREFNLEGKKRFYHLPDGLGGNEVLEREKGVDMTVFRKQTIEKPQVVDLSKNYQRIPGSQIVALTGTACFSEKQLKHAKLFKQDEYLDFWPKPGFEPKFDFVVAKLAAPINDIQVTSYASSAQNPKFYWPLPVFLDNKGCVLEGVNAFYQTTVAATVTMHQAIQGYLHIPQDTGYILFTPLEAAADLSEAELTNKGQVRLTPVR